MIEIKNILKTYYPKKGSPVKALDDVSIKFPEKGLIFILGKSGSGKSTLLNVIGGLDKYDSGEIIIKGKSSKDFTQSDFDSYRNTYLGFIFQEYNILEDFNIGANIALAIQLQGEKATDEKINNILREVDLEGYGRRKPNELSGGQKQRVAIARALVKNPDIILADEPTGALDSNTGIQVFDTLKKLSEEKLVIVVSHDRDFAELYGDRVIELKDGKVISDIEKVSEIGIKDDKPQEYNKHVLRFPRGYKLTQTDIKMIENYLKNNDAYLSFDKNLSEKLKEIEGITDVSSSSQFKETDESKIENTSGGFKLIKSKLPLKESLKIGRSSLKAKPVRLVFTIILCVFSFTMFGLFDSFGSYDSKKSVKESLIESKINYVKVNSVQEIKEKFYDYTYYCDRNMSMREINEISNETHLNFFPIYLKDELSYKNRVEHTSDVADYLFNSDIGGVLSLTKNEFENNTQLKILAGKYPTNSDECLISDLVYYSLKESGYIFKDDKHTEENNVLSRDKITSPEVLISNNISLDFSDFSLKVSGIFESGIDFSQYNTTRQETIEDIVKYMLKQIEYGDSFAGMIFVTPDGLNKIDSNRNTTHYLSVNDTIYDWYSIFFDDNYASFVNYMLKQSDLNNDNSKIYLFNEGIKNENDIIISIESIINGLNRWELDNTTKQKVEDLEELLFNKSGDVVSNIEKIALQSIDGFYYNYYESVSDEELINAITGVNKDKLIESYLSNPNYLATLARYYDNYAKNTPQNIYDVGYVYDEETIYDSFSGLEDSYIEMFNDLVLSDLENAKSHGVLEELSLIYKYYLYNNIFSTGTNIYDSSLTFETYRKRIVCDELYDSFKSLNNTQKTKLINYYNEQYVGAEDSEIQAFLGYCLYINNSESYNEYDNDFTINHLKYLYRVQVLDTKVNEIKSLLNKVNEIKVEYYYKGSSGDPRFLDVNIVGFYVGEDDVYDMYSSVIFYDSYINSITIEADAIYDSAIAYISPENSGDFDDLVDYFYGYTRTFKIDDGDDIILKYTMSNKVAYIDQYFSEILEVLAQAFLAVGIITLIFACALFCNYITTSIAYKKREIGVLRAIGATSKDVFGVFLCESMIIALITFVISIICSGAVVIILNAIIMGRYGIPIKLFIFGIRQIGITLGVSILTTVISSFIPVIKIAKKKPIDAINGR